MNKFSPIHKFEQIEDYWDPKVVAEFNGQQMRLAKLKGEFVWHAHQHEDEVFMVLEGELDIELREQTVHLSAGEVFVVPKGIEHRPVAKHEAKVMLIEPASTVNTGSTDSPMTKESLERI